ncbi:hypothetical protein D3877_28995 [Azospirillum cavernae]|uniref:Uncharacterized protein n=1 Tax=Azospirillum cavernae TaxID=2320860 RepID=A0A418VJU1_9PROT|nr:hypothetical protein [Azospirillum cavernae]RJF76424.1 hypothetical protein D3877_28995 [Azospirillum cavernae]
MTTLPDLIHQANEACTADGLRVLANILDHADVISRWTIEEAQRLGLPAAFAGHWPQKAELPVEYKVPRYGADASLIWKALEWKVRTGRIDACDPNLIAEALEGEAADDGPRWLDRALADLLFLLAWPARTYALHREIDFTAQRVVDAITSSPSCVLDLNIDAVWPAARHRLLMLDPLLDVPEECPWPTFVELAEATAARIEKGQEMERRIVRKEPVPPEYERFMR